MLLIHIMMSSKETTNKNKSRGVGDSIAKIIKKCLVVELHRANLVEKEKKP